MFPPTLSDFNNYYMNQIKDFVLQFIRNKYIYIYAIIVNWFMIHKYGPSDGDWIFLKFAYFNIFFTQFFK